MFKIEHKIMNERRKAKIYVKLSFQKFVEFLLYFHEEAGVFDNIGHPEVIPAGLPEARDLARPAQFKVELRDFKAVVLPAELFKAEAGLRVESLFFQQEAV